MEPEADELIKEAMNVNYIDESEYPSTTDIHNQCVPAHVEMPAAFLICVLSAF